MTTRCPNDVSLASVRHSSHKDLVVEILRMEAAFAEQFSAAWLDAWNGHDLDATLVHFADEVVFTSPVAERIVKGSGGVIRGNVALRSYWGEGLRRAPDLHFEIEGLSLGVATIVIHYRNHSGALVNEVLIFDGPLVIEGHATYLGP